MTITREEAKEYLDQRVRVKLGGKWEVGLLRAVTPKDVLILASHSGVETLIPVADVKAIEDGRYTCMICLNLVNRLFHDIRCADCEREYAATLPPPREICEDCGTEGAVRSPLVDKWLCPQCHAKAGTLSGLPAEARVLNHSSRTADCRTKGVDDPAHGPWRRAKSSYVCGSCYGKFYKRPATFQG